MGSPLQIVVNYRRQDSAGYAGRLYDDLAERFGEERIFMDIDAIEPGVDFPTVIERAVGSADVLLALIGPRWLHASDPQGRRRLDQPNDFVRLEIEAALRPEVRVIPVLLQGTEMPAAEELPRSLEPLTRRNALALRDSSWRYDVDRLIDVLRRVEHEKTAAGPEHEPGGGGRPARGHMGRRSAAGLAAAGALIAVAVVAAVLLLRNGGETAAASSTGELVYSRNHMLFTASLGGGSPRLLTTGETPDWSPDGRRIVFARRPGIWVVDAAGGSAEQLTTFDLDGSPDWSPDGATIAFDRERPGSRPARYDVDVMGANGTAPGPRPITSPASGSGSGGSPDWLPVDGSRIVYASKGDLWTMRPDGGDQVRIVSRAELGGGIALRPTWSPDGTRIAFQFGNDARSDVYVVDADGRNARNLTRGLAAVSGARGPAWSPDGTRIAFAADQGLMVMNADGTGLETVEPGSGFAAPAWRPAT